MLIQQNENADTVLVFKWIRSDGLCVSLFRMLYFFALCQRKGYYFVLDDQNFSVIPYAEVFKPFWSEETNRSVLKSAKQVHLFGYPPDEDSDHIIHRYCVSDDARFLNYGYDDLAGIGFKAYSKSPWEKKPLRYAEVREKYRKLLTLGAKHNLFTETDIADSWDTLVPAGLLSKIYQLQDNVQEQVDRLKQTAKLPEDYQAIQIRRKQEYLDINYYLFFEKPPLLKDYLDKLDSDIQDVHVATETEDVVKQLRREEGGTYKYHSFIHKNENPHIEIDAKSRQERADSLVYLLADIELCTQAERFIGDNRSSVSNIILYLRRDLGKEVDYPVKWKRVAWHVILRGKRNRLYGRLKNKLNRLLNS